MMITTRINVEQTYSGKPGCMCGCNGTYHEADSVASSRIFNKVMKDATRKVDEAAGCVYVETATRFNAVYFKKEQANAAE